MPFGTDCSHAINRSLCVDVERQYRQLYVTSIIATGLILVNVRYICLLITVILEGGI